MIKIEFNGVEIVDRILTDLPKEADKIKYRAVQRAALAGKTEATKQGRNKYNLPTSEITKTFNLIKPTKNNAVAHLTSTGKRVRLIKFKVNPNKVHKKKKVVRVSVLKAQGMKTLKNAFIAKMPNGIIGVFEREGENRMPIRQLYGPSIPQLFKDSTVKQAIQNKAFTVLENRIAHELERYIGE